MAACVVSGMSKQARLLETWAELGTGTGTA